MAVSSIRYQLIVSIELCSHSKFVLHELSKGYYQHELQVINVNRNDKGYSREKYMDIDMKEVHTDFFSKNQIWYIPIIIDLETGYRIRGKEKSIDFVRQHYPPISNIKPSLRVK
uniref:Thioredoxin-fold protein n=1 Tax=Marseillevirus LCMAC101 TaxID=2506602 RepID=A0A481YRC2_9VIRU|nr:MAG: hypothetical protein LCMAC101_03230 [Marseillevirus LCMAC101]